MFECIFSSIAYIYKQENILIMTTESRYGKSCLIKCLFDFVSAITKWFCNTFPKTWHEMTYDAIVFLMLKIFTA